MVKRLLKTLLVGTLQAIEQLVFRLVLALTKQKKIVFLDIDNTLADTWPTLVQGSPVLPEHIRLAGLKPLSGSVRFVQNQFGPDYLRVYLSHRSFLMYMPTKRWLQRHNLLRPNDLLFLVHKVSSKELFFMRAIKVKKFKELVIMDDLSHSHEHGRILFYDDTINLAKNPPFTYIGYGDILKINMHE